MKWRQLSIVVVVNIVISSLVFWGGSQLVPRDAERHYSIDAMLRSQHERETGSPTDTLVDMITAVNPAVVSIVVTKDVPIYEEYYEQFDPWGWFGGGFSIPRVREKGTEEREVGGGSGFIVSSEGHVVTNRHVVADEEADYSLLLNDGTVKSVSVLARDPQLDIAILKIEDIGDTKLAYLTFGTSSSLRLGETVVAIGNALGEFRNSVSVGVVSGLARSITASDEMGRVEQLDEVIQTDAAINPGNSGGPLLNRSGQVIGVNVATSRGADNISFALPSDVVASVVASVKEHGKIVRPYLGVRYTMLTERMAEANNLPYDAGALIQRGATPEELAVMPGSPADKAGLTENDIILAIDDVPLATQTLASVLRSKSVGQTITLKVYQKGEERTISVTLEAAP